LRWGKFQARRNRLKAASQAGEGWQARGRASKVRQCAIGKGHSVSVLWRGGEVDTIFGFEKEADALQWIKDKSQGWLLENKKATN
jgi:hypothetical protein